MNMLHGKWTCWLSVLRIEGIECYVSLNRMKLSDEKESVENFEGIVQGTVLVIKNCYY